MPTILTHAVAAGALVAAFPAKAVPRRLALVGAVCAMVPDIDVLGFHFGIHYGDLLGHRGLSHSLFIAAIVATAALVIIRSTLRPTAHRGAVWLYLFLATASHGFLDAFTNGGLGVAFFSPFELTRYFFPLRPIAVSPIGAGFFTERGLSVLVSEFRWVWLPAIAFVAAAILLRKLLRARPAPTVY